MNGLAQGSQLANGTLPAGAAGVTLIVALIAYVILVIGYWKLFNKMGEPGWKSIIPIYNTYVLFDKIWAGIYGVLAPLLMAIGSGINQSNPTGMLAIIGSVTAIAGAVIWIVGLYKLAKAFGKGIGYFFLLMLLQGIAILILAFGSAQYQGKPE